MCFCLECICLLFWLPPLLWRPNPLLHWCPFFSLDPTLYYLIIIQPPASWVVFIFSKFLISRNCWCLCVHYQVLDKHFHLTFNYNKLLVIENIRLGDKSEIPKNKLSAVKQVSMHQDTLQKTAWTLSKITVLTQVYVCFWKASATAEPWFRQKSILNLLVTKKLWMQWLHIWLHICFLLQNWNCF